MLVFLLHARPRVRRAPGIPRALFSERAERSRKTRVNGRGENAVVRLAVMARSPPVRRSPPSGEGGLRRTGGLLAMTARRTTAFSPRPFARVWRLRSALSEKMARGIPGAQRTRSLACSKKTSIRVSHHEYTGTTRHSPRDGFNGYSALAPVRRAFWPPSPALLNANLTPASGCQDHTSSPSASGAARLEAPSASTASCPALVTLANAPPMGQDGCKYSADLRF